MRTDKHTHTQSFWHGHEWDDKVIDNIFEITLLKGVSFFVCVSICLLLSYSRGGVGMALGLEIKESDGFCSVMGSRI